MRNVLVPMLVSMALLLSACGGGGGDEAAGPSVVNPTLAEAPTITPNPPDVVTEPDVLATASPTPGAADGGAEPTDVPDDSSTAPVTGTGVPDLDAVSVSLVEVAAMEAPIAAAVRPGDGTLYVAERAGRVRSLAADGSLGAPILDISGDTTTSGERGLLGIAWAADGQRLYLSSTDTEGATNLEAVDVVDGVLQADTRTELLRVPQPASNHNGGDVRIGPDGMLWLALGDGGAADDRFGNGQRPDTLLGTMLRIDPDGGDPYAIPADNPFADGADGAPEVWAYGLRNPWRFSFDTATGDLWIADVGQNAIEEINRVPATAGGLNYGWPTFEGPDAFSSTSLVGADHTPPVHTYDHSRGCSITGGLVYRGLAIDGLQGAYLYSDYCNGTIYAYDPATGADVDLGISTDQVVSFAEGPDREVYVLSLGGAVLRIE